jgi:hypothetical protein
MSFLRQTYESIACQFITENLTATRHRKILPTFSLAAFTKEREGKPALLEFGNHSFQVFYNFWPHTLQDTIQSYVKIIGLSIYQKWITLPITMDMHDKHLNRQGVHKELSSMHNYDVIILLTHTLGCGSVIWSHQNPWTESPPVHPPIQLSVFARCSTRRSESLFTLHHFLGIKRLSKRN